MLELHNVTKTFHYKVALNRLNLHLEKGKLYGLIGNNGAGKTTLLNLIAYQSKPSEGTILFEGHTLREKDLASIAYFSDHSLFADREKVKNILQQYAYFFDDFDTTKALEILQGMDIQQSDILGKMSSGTRKKCELAFVLSRRATLYLLDEPFANLDPLVRSELMEMIVRYARPEASYMMSTHQVQEIETYIDEIILIKDGELLIQGNNDELREQYQCSIAELLVAKLKEK